MSENTNGIGPEALRAIVREKYGEAAKAAQSGRAAGCGGGEITGDLYSRGETQGLPEAAVLASLGCGNPTALATLAPGEVVLDLGSGGGIDVLLSAQRVGPTGFAYGVDMTDEMLALAEQNRLAAGVENVRFLKGEIEAIPLPDASVDVVISNCVINLSADKERVLAEAFRVLKPGGRFAVSDVVVDGPLPEAIQRDMEAYVGCVAGALERDEYLSLLARAGFEDRSIEPTRRYTFEGLTEATGCCGAAADLAGGERDQLDGRVMSTFIRARKPTG